MQYTNGNPAKIERNLTIANERLAGQTYSQLAEKHNLSKTHIHAILNDEEIKDIIKTGTKQLVSMVPIAVDNYYSFLTDKDSPDHYKASKDCLQTTGILASHTQSLTINNILAVNSDQQPDNIKRIQELIQSRHETDLSSSDDIIDVSADDIRDIKDGD